VYLVSLKPLDVDATLAAVAAVAGSEIGVNQDHASTLSEPTVQPVQPNNPVSSEKKWVSDLLSEFFNVFQDPLPVGLPSVRAEGHSIPTEQVIHLRFGKCTVYLRWNIVSWKSKSPRF
jgi:hypothetical protein